MCLFFLYLQNVHGFNANGPHTYMVLQVYPSPFLYMYYKQGIPVTEKMGGEIRQIAAGSSLPSDSSPKIPTPTGACFPPLIIQSNTPQLPPSLWSVHQPVAGTSLQNSASLLLLYTKLFISWLADELDIMKKAAGWPLRCFLVAASC